MKKSFCILILFVLVGALALSACGGAKTEAPDQADETIPAEYVDMKNPSADDANAVSVGKESFAGKCATCHGESGKGDGAGGAALNPKPNDLTALGAKSDGYIYWRIAEGGTAEPFRTQGSAMPAWKNILSEDEIWQLVSYIRSLQ